MCVVPQLRFMAMRLKIKLTWVVAMQRLIF